MSSTPLKIKAYVMVIVLGNRSGYPSSNSAWVCIFLCTETLEKGMNPSFLPTVLGE